MAVWLDGCKAVEGCQSHTLGWNPHNERGKRHWKGRQEQQQAVYQNRQSVPRDYGKSLLRRRGELVERTFSHCDETGGMRRCTLRGRENIFKRPLIHVGAFNISLVLGKMLGSGKPRELINRAAARFCALSSFSSLYADPGRRPILSRRRLRFWARSCSILGGHLKTGHTWSLQNRPTGLA